jgi:hypothetical protein
MSEEAMKQMIQGMLENLEQSGAEMEGLSLDDLRDAMSHPKAAAFLADWMPHEAASVQQGASAPDFTLPYLPGYAKEGDTMTLSSHFRSALGSTVRPVALIFGSYT